MTDRARVTVRVDAARDLAFTVFTEEIDTWWRKGKRYRMTEGSTMSLEPRVGGRFREVRGARSWEMGEVLVWDPPKRLVLAWRPVNFRPADPSTEVEVVFERAIGHQGEATMVTIEHRGWDQVRPDHPVRHGQAARAFILSTGRWWGDLMSALRERVLARGSPDDSGGSP